MDLNGRTQSFSVAGGGAQILTLPRPGLWAITVQNGSSTTSDYTLSIENAAPQLSPVRLKVVPGSTSGTIQITANIDATLTNATANLVRFWLGSTGITQTTATPIPAFLHHGNPIWIQGLLVYVLNF